MGKNDIFQNIKKKIEKREFNSAIKDLTKISTSKKSSKEDKSYANYLIGFINNNYFYDDKDTEQGKNALIKCIESEFPIPEAFSILSSLEDDKNIAINCLKKGKSLFPDSPTIYRSLLNCPISKADCLTYINEVKKREIKDFYLFNQILEYLISQHLWEETKYFTKIIIDSPNVEIEKKLTYRVNRFHLRLFQLVQYSTCKYIQNLWMLVNSANLRLATDIFFSYCGIGKNVMMQCIFLPHLQ